MLMETIVLLRIDGDDFEIVGHEFPTSEATGQAAAPEQLAALPDPGSAADLATSAALGAVPAEPGDEASLQAVETLLRERDDEFRRSLERYITTNNVEFVDGYLGVKIRRVWLRDTQ